MPEAIIHRWAIIHSGSALNAVYTVFRATNYKMVGSEIGLIMSIIKVKYPKTKRNRHKKRFTKSSSVGQYSVVPSIYLTRLHTALL